MLKEACVENFTNIPAAIVAGAGRIELNDNLAVGGTTVSRGVMAAAAAYTKEAGIPLVAMIRPRGGDFVYSDEELAMMIGDLRTARDCGVPTVTFCVNTADGQLDTDAMALLIENAAPMTVVCHMGFDALKPDVQLAAIDWLATHGVARILTHGGLLTAPIADTLPQLRKYVDYAHGRITILPGGGITAANVAAVVDALGVNEAHGTRIVNY